MRPHAIAAVLFLPAFLVAQTGQAAPKASEHFPVLAWPRDRERVLAEVDGKPLRLEDLARHIEERHSPGFREFLATDAGNLLLRSDGIATWVRQFADVRALAAEARARNITPEAAEPALSASLKNYFQHWLDDYVAGLARQGHPTQITQERVNHLLSDFQLKHGLACELGGWLDFLEPDDYTDKQLRDYLNDHARYFGGTVTIAHILVQHRDAGTGILLDDEGQKRALSRLADVRARLRPDGSNFAEVAALMSEDTVTAAKGGVLRDVARFDDRLPAILCRTAWFVKEGEISDVVESQYGYHIVKRLEFNQHRFILFTDDAKPEIRSMMRRDRQEDLLFKLRASRQVTLKY